MPLKKCSIESFGIRSNYHILNNLHKGEWKWIGSEVLDIEKDILNVKVLNPLTWLYDSFVSFLVKKVRVFWGVLFQKIGKKLNHEGGRKAF